MNAINKYSQKNQISEIYTHFSRDKNMKLTQEEM